VDPVALVAEEVRAVAEEVRAVDRVPVVVLRGSSMI
jgi:hypothetical protein